MKPSIPKGTRDYTPGIMARRNYILDTICNIYTKFGFKQIETPAMENLSSLEGKYGEEGDKLLFRVLNSGPVVEQIKEARGEIKISDITEKGLRYDLTVPFARYVVMHQNEITFPFRRYQVQPVWRADRPQKGRYREFYQCDADIIGSASLLNEVELIQIIDEVFTSLGIKVTIKINNRKLLSGLIEIIDATDKAGEIITLIDKIDKLTKEKFIEELNATGLNAKQVDTLLQVLEAGRSGTDLNLGMLDSLLLGSAIAKKGIDEVKSVLRYFGSYDWVKSESFESLFKLNNKIELDLSLARGLNYYTGMIIEVKVSDERSSFTSSVLGGGRYDDLTGIFGLPGVSGVGISFGIDRIYDVMEEYLLFKEEKLSRNNTQVLFVNFGHDEELASLKFLQQIRMAGIAAEIYPDQSKMKKQMSYADDNNIPFVAIIGSEEKEQNVITLKVMKTGEQEKLSIDALIQKLKSV